MKEAEAVQLDESLFFDELYPKLEYYTYRHGGAEWHYDPMEIDFHDLSYVISGKTYLIANGKEWEVKAGDLIYLPPGSFRDGRSAGCEVELFPMNFTLSRIEVQDAKGEILVPRQMVERLPFETVTGIGIHPEIIALFQDLWHVWLQRQPGYKLMTRAYTELLISKLLELAVYRNPLRAADPRIQRLIHYITEHYADPLRLDDMAEMLHLTPVYLSTLFHQNMGVTLKKYINTLRINNAAGLLKSGMCNVTEAAEASGFADAAHFSRTFSRIKGYNPSQIARKHSS